MKPKFKVTLLSHSFVITDINASVKPFINEFAKRNIQYTTEYRRGYGYIKKPSKVFAAANGLRTEFRFHRHEFADFCNFMADRYVKREDWKVKTREFKQPATIELKLNPMFSDRDYQGPLVEFCSRMDLHTKVVPLQTGKGKTYIACRASEEIGFRTGLITASRFLNQWSESLQEQYDLPRSAIWIIRGNVELKKYIRAAKDKTLDATHVLFSNTTLQVFIKNYEANRKKTILDYGCAPEDLLEIGGIGLKIVDEAHLFLHLNFKLDLYCHVPTAIYLSATLETEDQFINKVTSIIYPMESRYFGVAYDKYIDAICWFYSLKTESQQRIRTTQRGRDSYSHSALEQSIMKDPKLMMGYLEMIAASVKSEYIMKRKDAGMKCIVFADLVEMCEEITEYLKSCFPELDIRKYTAEDEDENLYTPEIVVTTPGSCGTGKDVKNLFVVFATNAVGGMQLNLQMLGRLRVIKDYKGVTPVYIYFSCLDIPKHMDYHRKKLEIFDGKVLSHNTIKTDFAI